MRSMKPSARAQERADEKADERADSAADDRAEAKSLAKTSPPKAAPVRVSVPSGQNVYSPLDEVAVFKHNGLEYPLVPNGTSAIVSRTKGVTDAQVAEYAVARLGMWGVCLTAGPVKRDKGKGVASSPEDQAIVDAAEVKYAAAMLKWAEDQVIEDNRANELRVRSGLAPKHTNEYLRARAYLSKSEKSKP